MNFARAAASLIKNQIAKGSVWVIFIPRAAKFKIVQIFVALLLFAIRFWAVSSDVLAPCLNVVVLSVELSPPELPVRVLSPLSLTVPSVIGTAISTSVSLTDAAVVPIPILNAEIAVRNSDGTSWTRDVLTTSFGKSRTEELRFTQKDSFVTS